MGFSGNVSGKMRENGSERELSGRVGAGVSYII